MLRLFLFACLLPFLAAAQTDATFAESDALEAIPFVAYWAKGDVYRFAVTKVNYQTKNEEVTKNDTTRYTGRFEVLDSTASSYTIKWTMENHSPLSDAATELLSGLEMTDVVFTDIIYSTDELGAYQKIENLAEIQSFVKGIVDKLLEQPPFNLPSTSEEAKAAIQATLRRMESPDFIELGLFPEIRQLHSTFGAEYSRTDTIRYDDEFLIPLWNGKAKAYGTVYLDSVDVSDDYAHLKQLVEVDTDDMKTQLAAYMGSLGVQGAELDNALKESTYYTYEDNDFHFYYYPGIPIYVDCFRKVYMKLMGSEVEAIVSLQIEWVE